jgi:hypothetical protein
LKLSACLPEMPTFLRRENQPLEAT